MFTFVERKNFIGHAEAISNPAEYSSECSQYAVWLPLVSGWIVPGLALPLTECFIDIIIVLVGSLEPVPFNLTGGEITHIHTCHQIGFMLFQNWHVSRKMCFLYEKWLLISYLGYRSFLHYKTSIGFGEVCTHSSSSGCSFSSIFKNCSWNWIKKGSDFKNKILKFWEVVISFPCFF